MNTATRVHNNVEASGKRITENEVSMRLRRASERSFEFGEPPASDELQLNL